MTAVDGTNHLFSEDGGEGKITRLLRAWSSGQEGAADELMALTYEKLRRRATSFLSRERKGHTLETSDLINETYLRLLEQRQIDWRNRTQFMALAARMMRRILVNHARDRATMKRGGSFEVLCLDDAPEIRCQRGASILGLDDALNSLAKSRPDLAEVVELRFFGGLSNQEIAGLKSLSIPTIVRRWRLARACLNLLLAAGTSSPGPAAN